MTTSSADNAREAARRRDGKFGAQVHAEGPSLTAPVTVRPVWEPTPDRAMVNAVFTAGRGMGRNRYGNVERIQEAFDATAAYVGSLPPEPANDNQAKALAKYKQMRDDFEQDRGSLDSKELRTRMFEVARQGNWILEYNSPHYN